MKKIYLAFLAVFMVFTACEDTYNDQFEGLDEIIDGKREVVKTVELTLTDADYDDMGVDGYFDADNAPADLIPDFLAEKYYTYDAGTACKVTFKYSYSSKYLDQISSPTVSATEYTLVAADYDSMGEDEDEPGEYDNFSYKISPEDYLPAFVAEKFPDAEVGDVYKITYEYYDYGTKTLSVYYYLSEDGFASLPGIYELTDDDYDFIGAGSNFDDLDEANTYIKQYLNNKPFFATTGSVLIVQYEYYTKNNYRYFRVNADNSVEEVTYDSDAYELKDEDYNNSFGSYTYVSDAESALPTLATTLNHTLPYVYKAKIYKNYYDKFATYTFDGTTWDNTPSMIEKTEQYVFTAGNKWVFDPAVVFSINSADYQMVVDWVKTNKGDEYIDSYGNTEFYSGMSAYYENIDYTLSKIMGVDTREAHDERIKETIGVLLSLKFPDAVAQVNGVDVFYTVKYETYNGDDGSRANYYIKYQCTGAGTFTYIEGPTKE